jgi:hypothetical protein
MAGRKIRQIFNKDYSDIGTDDILEAFGLQRVAPTGSYVLPALSFLGLGMIVGAGLGMLFAPRSGHDLRDTIGRRASKLGRRVGMGGRGEEEFEGYEGGRSYESTGYEGAGIGTTGIGSSGVIGSTYEGKGPYPTSPGGGGQ